MNVLGFQITRDTRLRASGTAFEARTIKARALERSPSSAHNGVPARSVTDFVGPTFNSWGYPAQNDLLGRSILSDPRDAYILSLPWKLTPQQVLTILRQALGGDLWSSAQLNYLMLTTWPLYRMASHQLREAVAYAKFTVKPCAVEGEEPSKPAAEKAALVERAIKGFAPNQFADESGFSGLCYHLLDAALQGLSVCEVMWQEVRTPKVGKEMLPRAAAWVHPKHYTFTNEGTLTIFGQDMSVIFDQYQFKTPGMSSGGWTGQAINRSQPNQAPLPNPDKFLCAQFLSRSGSTLGAGFMGPLAWYWSARMWGNEWMLQAAKKYGSPFLTISYRPGVSDQEDRDKLKAFAQEASSDRYLIHPEGSIPTVHPAGNLGQDNPQRHIVEEADRMCLYLLLGQSGTTQQTAGKLGDDGTKQDVKLERVKALADWLARNPLRQFARSVLRQNYGEETDCPEISADFTRPLSAPEVGGLATAISGSGVPVLASEFYNKLGFTQPEPGDMVYQRGQVTEMLTEEEKFAQQLQQQQAQAELQIGMQREAAAGQGALNQVGGQAVEAKRSDHAPLPLPVVKATLGRMGASDLSKLGTLVAKAERAKDLNGDWTEIESLLKGRA